MLNNIKTTVEGLKEIEYQKQLKPFILNTQEDSMFWNNYLQTPLQILSPDGRKCKEPIIEWCDFILNKKEDGIHLMNDILKARLFKEVLKECNQDSEIEKDHLERPILQYRPSTKCVLKRKLSKKALNEYTQDSEIEQDLMERIIFQYRPSTNIANTNANIEQRKQKSLTKYLH